MSESLLIVGASVRAAAMSARRAGFSPVAIDRFADRDLQAIAETIHARRFPHDLVELAAQVRPMPWIYTGPIENHPEIISALAETRPLWGCDAHVLRRIRDPFEIEALLRQHDLPAPRCFPPHASPGFKTLVKPRQGGGGIGIRSPGESPAASRDEYLQEFIDGIPCSAAFIGDGRDAELVGFSRQFIGMSSQSVAPFAFCGAITPWPIPRRAAATMSRVGTLLAREMHLRGLFACDFVLCGELPFPVEVNPRYTATVELYERCSPDRPLLAAHARACRETHPPSPRSRPLLTNFTRHSVKLILFAAASFAAPDLGVVGSLASGTTFPRFADLPHEETLIRRGEPICTLFADGADPRETLARLVQHLTALARRIPADALDVGALVAEVETALRDNHS